MPAFADTQYRIGCCISNDRDIEGLLVELTGIEPVASWLQTRRSPS